MLAQQVYHAAIAVYPIVKAVFHQKASFLPQYTKRNTNFDTMRVKTGVPFLFMMFVMKDA